jgi:predicted nucleic acid-binding Zn ribbon protein
MATPRSPHYNSLQRRVLSEWRGLEEPLDWTGHEHGIANVLEKIFAKAKFEERVTEEELALVWRAAVSEFVAQNSKAISLDNGILHVAVLQPSIRYTLQSEMRSKILPKLKHAIPGNEIRDVRFRLC